MEVVVSSPVSEDEEEQSQEEVPLPGLDILSSGMNMPDSPIAEAVSPYSQGSSHGSPEQSSSVNEVGPATPSGEQSRDDSESFSASNAAEPISQDEDSQQRLQRTPSSPDEIGDEESASGEAESEKNDQSADAASSSMEPPLTRDVEVEEESADPSSPFPSTAIPGLREVDNEESADPSSPFPSTAVPGLGEVDNEESADPSSPFPSTAVPGLDFGEDASASADYVPGLDSPNKAPQESKGMYAFLSTGPDEEEEEEETEAPAHESIPFLGGDSVPSPGEEMEQEASEGEPEKGSETQETEEESRAEAVMETQVLSEVEDEIVSPVEHQVDNDVHVEAQMDVVEQVVETSEVADVSGAEVMAHVEEVAPAESQEKETEKLADVVEAKETGEAPRSPQQIVEEVFLTTDGTAKKQESGEESDFDGFEASEAAPKPSRKRRARVIDEDEDEEGEESDFDGFEPEENKKGDRQGLIADIFDIFGQSDDEGEFDGFAEAEVPPAGQEVTSEGEIAEAEKEAEKEEEEESPDGKKKKKKKKDGESSSSSSEDEGVVDRPPSMAHMSDFEAMQMRKKEENRRRRRRRNDNIDNINVGDDLAVALISDMKMAASLDRDLVMQKMPAIQKLRMLPQVVGMLKKSDLQMSLIDCGVLSAITEWLSPLPDRSLPALPIRRSLLQALSQLPGIGADSLKESGVGKAVMYLNKHPKEVSDNRKTAGKLIYNWSRPIFDLKCDYKSLSKEERQKRDMENLPKKRSITATDSAPKRDIDKEMSGDSRPLRPGDPGWVARARVPLPSNKDYVVRPRSKVETASGEAAPPRKVGRFEKHIRKIKDSKGKVKFQKAVGMSLEGRKMAL